MFNLLRDYDATRGRLSWVQFIERKGNKVIGKSSFTVTLPVDYVYALAHNILRDEYLRDYSKFRQFADSQKEQYYSEDGTVKTDLLTMKRYKNGKAEIIFDTETEAKLFFDKVQKLEMMYQQNQREYDRWIG
jgi:hypothetical protein